MAKGSRQISTLIRLSPEAKKWAEMRARTLKLSLAAYLELLIVRQMEAARLQGGDE